MAVPDPIFKDSPDVEWVRAWASPAVAAVLGVGSFAGLGLFVASGNLPVVLAAGLVGLGLVLIVRERPPFTDPRGCTDAAVVVQFGSYALALACGLVVSVQRAVWVDGTPVGWWVHVLVALGIVAATGTVSFAAVVASFAVNVDAAFLGANWGVLVGVIVAFQQLWIVHSQVWPSMLWGAVTAVLLGPVLTALLRVRLVPIEPNFGWTMPPAA